MSKMRGQFRRFCRYIMSWFITELNEKDLTRTAIVFSPHPDDETLGCGGTIIKKKIAGAEVKIFFMTDGRKSHQHLIEGNKLKLIRAKEALEAGQMLGLNEEDIGFLEYKDEELDKNQDSAIQKVTEILLRLRPDEIFIPYKREAPLDHFFTNRIVVAALQKYKRKTIIYEYPIWFWYHWPWVSVPMANLNGILATLKRSVIAGLYFLMEFRCSVYIGDVLALKRAVLDSYISQMTRFLSDPRWRTLGDISNGEFLECFFQEHEIFHKYIIRR